jgi:hypothetical protein
LVLTLLHSLPEFWAAKNVALLADVPRFQIAGFVASSRSVETLAHHQNSWETFESSIFDSCFEVASVLDFLLLALGLIAFHTRPAEFQKWLPFSLAPQHH